MGLFSKNEKEMPAPPMPMTSQENSSNLVPPSMEISRLSAPPMPGGSLDDIKAQVSLRSSPSIQSMPQIKEPEMKKVSEVEENNNFEEDSLFDFSELDVEEPEMKKEVISVESHTSLEDLSFIKQNKKEKKFETFFITTKQFKTLLEIVDSVKKKVKEANETHLRLMDIKAEEDIEYENLRKDFEFIEDKLYEVDNIIFEK